MRIGTAESGSTFESQGSAGSDLIDQALRSHAQALLGSVDIRDDDFIAVHLPLAGAKALGSRDIGAQLQCPMSNETVTWLASSVLLHATPWANGDLDHLLQKNRDYRETAIRRTEIRGIHEDSCQSAVTNLLVTHRRVDATLVRNVAAAVETACRFQCSVWQSSGLPIRARSTSSIELLKDSK